MRERVVKNMESSFFQPSSSTLKANSQLKREQDRVGKQKAVKEMNNPGKTKAAMAVAATTVRLW